MDPFHVQGHTHVTNPTGVVIRALRLDQFSQHRAGTESVKAKTIEVAARTSGSLARTGPITRINQRGGALTSARFSVGRREWYILAQLLLNDSTVGKQERHVSACSGHSDCQNKTAKGRTSSCQRRGLGCAPPVDIEAMPPAAVSTPVLPGEGGRDTSARGARTWIADTLARCSPCCDACCRSAASSSSSVGGAQTWRTGRDARRTQTD